MYLQQTSKTIEICINKTLVNEYKFVSKQTYWS